MNDSPPSLHPLLPPSRLQGCVHGILVLSPTALLFRPHSADPIVVEEGREGLEVLMPFEDIVYAALTMECGPPERWGRGGRESPETM